MDYTFNGGPLEGFTLAGYNEPEALLRILEQSGLEGELELKPDIGGWEVLSSGRPCGRHERPQGLKEGVSKGRALSDGLRKEGFD